MNSPTGELRELTEQIIGCAMEVHRHLGPGLLEAAYEAALRLELAFQKVNFERQKILPVEYKGRYIGNYRVDILVENKVVMQLKSVSHFDPVFSAQIMNYMRLGGFKVGLLVNFNSRLLREGIKRFVL